MELSKGLNYVKSTPGLLKIFEFVALLIALSCTSKFVSSLHNTRGTWSFFLFVVAASCFLSAISFFFFTLGIHKKLKVVNWTLTVGIVFLPFTVLLLIASAILADNTRIYKVTNMCDSWESSHRDIDCNNLIVSVIFGFIAFLLYSFDTLLHFWLNVLVEDESPESDETAQFKPNSQVQGNGTES